MRYDAALIPLRMHCATPIYNKKHCLASALTRDASMWMEKQPWQFGTAWRGAVHTAPHRSPGTAAGNECGACPV